MIFFIKVTEIEIFEGILINKQDPNKTALCFIRNIENLEENLNDPAISRFIDIEYKRKDKIVKVDSDAKYMLETLKHKNIPSRLNVETNVFKFNVNKIPFNIIQ